MWSAILVNTSFINITFNIIVFIYKYCKTINFCILFICRIFESNSLLEHQKVSIMSYDHFNCLNEWVHIPSNFKYLKIYASKINCPSKIALLLQDMGFQRHKLVVNVILGENKDQGVHAVSRCVWNEKTDNFASGYYKNKHLFCVAMVHAAYFDWEMQGTFYFSTFSIFCIKYYLTIVNCWSGILYIRTWSSWKTHCKDL